MTNVPEYKPDYDEHSVAFCSHELCPQYDGKRCRLTGFQPHGVCEPWGIDAAKDHRAMDALRADDGYNGCLDQVEDTEGNPLWYAEVGCWGTGEASDPADAIIKAQEAHDKHLR